MCIFYFVRGKMINLRSERLILTSSVENQSPISHSQIWVDPKILIPIYFSILLSKCG